MKALLVLCLAFTACQFFDSKYVPAAELSGHVAECNAKSASLIAREKAKGDECEEIRAELEILFATDPDCKTYMGDAGSTVTCTPQHDGGAE